MKGLLTPRPAAVKAETECADLHGKRQLQLAALLQAKNQSVVVELVSSATGQRGRELCCQEEHNRHQPLRGEGAAAARHGRDFTLACPVQPEKATTTTGITALYARRSPKLPVHRDSWFP